MAPPVSLDALLKISAALTGAVIGWMAVLKPIVESCRKRRANKRKAAEDALQVDRQYRQAVLSKLESLDARFVSMDNSIADLQRDNIERAYCMFKLEHGYCPSGMKESISDMYESYRARGHNHIARSRIDELLALPEHPNR